MSLSNSFRVRAASRAFMATCVAAAALLAGCSERVPQAIAENHSYARPTEVVVTHMALDLEVDFGARRLRGSATLRLDRAEGAKWLWLDTQGLRILAVREGERTLEWSLGESDALFGAPLAIALGSAASEEITVEYETGADARALQWLDPGQTGGGRFPFLYTQSQPILARSWVPCQDNPGVRFTYDARIRVPAELLALMSASNRQEKSPTGEYTFKMPQPIPSYLLALAVGDLEFRPIAERVGVYAEPGMIDAAAWEFAETGKMMEATERLYGPYRWERFDVLVLPPSFPYGGMENPRLTFVTPILVAGDRSLVSTIAHELAHSWSGNLVTNESWDDFWLNEGFTTYLERRIMEDLYGRDQSEMHAILGLAELEEEVAAEPSAEILDTALHVPLAGRDPDVELNAVPYEKGYLFLRMLEEAVGRDRMDAFLRAYFERNTFRPMTSTRFLDDLRTELLGGDESLWRDLRIDEWVWQGGIPGNVPRPRTERFDRVDAGVAAFLAGAPAAALETEGWTTQQWEHFLAALPRPLATERLADLRSTFGFAAANGVVRRSWFSLAIESERPPFDPALEDYLLRVGRTWLLRPIYTRLAGTDEGLAWAREVYSRARPGYHPTTRSAIDGIVGETP